MQSTYNWVGEKKKLHVTITQTRFSKKKFHSKTQRYKTQWFQSGILHLLPVFLPASLYHSRGKYRMVHSDLSLST